MKEHRIVSRAEWIEARRQLLAKEKELTRMRDQLSRQRRELPWVRVDKQYSFETAGGRRTLAELFDGRSQLLIYHFMFGPDADVGCKSCSFWADSFNGIVPHLNQRDVTFAAISRAPLARLQAFRARMHWSFDWVSSHDSDFNFDYGVSFSPAAVESGTVSYNYADHKAYGTEMPGVSVFLQDRDGSVLHTYSAYGRGIDVLNTTYNYLDLVPKGRDEDGLQYPMAWVRFRDEYSAGSARSG